MLRTCLVTASARSDIGGPCRVAGTEPFWAAGVWMGRTAADSITARTAEFRRCALTPSRPSARRGGPVAESSASFRRAVVPVGYQS